ncbi:MAG: O-succinylbenzoate synthase, partial [Actinomycetes bacterium]
MSSAAQFQEVFNDFVVVAIPTRTNFRGINVREAALFRGPAGWSEFSPFLEYENDEARTWLKAAVEGAFQEWPILLRSEVKINATLPRVSAEQVPEILARFPGCTTIKIKIDDF